MFGQTLNAIPAIGSAADANRSFGKQIIYLVDVNPDQSGTAFNAPVGIEFEGELLLMLAGIFKNEIK